MVSRICDHMSPEDHCAVCLKRKIGDLDVIRSEERELCARLVERERLQLDGSFGLTPETDFIATRIVDHLAAKIRQGARKT
jgi:hypothetical protein